MAIITYDGFENYSSFDAVKSYLNYTNTGTIQVINSTDGNGVTPRNGGSCLKMTSSGRTFPRVYFRTPTGTHNISGVVGFAIYPILPSGGSFGTFTPIGANIRGSNSHSNPVPNFIIGINSNMNIEIRRPLWLSAGSVYQTLSGPDNGGSSHYFSPAAGDYGCGKNGCDSTAYLSDYFTGAIVGTSTSVLTLNQWNYVEIKYVLRGQNKYWEGTDNSPAALTQVKINRNRTDNVLDMNSSTLNAGLNQNGVTGWGASELLGQYNCGKQGCSYTGANWFTRGFAFGIVHSDTARIWNTYIDDFYWTDLSGTADNDFLGRVMCKKFNYDTVNTYTFSNPSSSSTGLSRVSETFSGTTSMTSVVAGNQFSQNVNLRVASITENKAPINVRQYVLGYKLETNSTLALSSSLSGSESSTSKVTFGTDATNGHLQHRDYTNAPDGAEWTNQKIADTTFKHVITTVT
jgi:hypothetical protein